MLQNNTLELFPTSRAIRIALEDFKNNNQIIPKLMTIGEFEQKAVYVHNRSFIDEDTRVLLLKEACSFSEFKKLKLPTEFFSFFKNSKFIFSFLDELAQEKIDIKSLSAHDIYLEYEEHMAVLELVRENYIKLLDKNGYCDKLTMPSLYQLNNSFIKSFSKIVLNLEGYLTNYEIELFLKISKLTNVEVRFQKTSFNQNMFLKLEPFGENLKTFEIKNNTRLITKESFKDELLQVAFIKRQVYEFLKKGIKAEDIAVVLPDKAFALHLQNFDYENNFNYAFGYPFSSTLIYKKLEAVYNFLSEQNIENVYRLKRYFSDIDFIKEFKTKPYFEILKSLNHDENKIYLEELYLFEKLLPHIAHLPFEKVLHLFLNRLSKRSEDDVSGGKVTVLEILETRQVKFKAVIIPNFNEGKVPKSVKKDMFISSSLRKKVGLPTISDRQNLQKQLYQNIIYKAEYVAISLVENEQNTPSRFLDELDLDIKEKFKNPKQYLELFFNKNNTVSYNDKESIVLDYDFPKVELSATRLKTFLECRRRYYYSYIKQIKDHQIPTDEITPREIGETLHLALKHLYKEKSFYLNEEDLILELQKEAYKVMRNDEVFKFHIDLWLKRLHKFSKNEMERFSEGFRVKEVEKSFKTDYNGFKLTGQIDRIDVKDNKLYLLDYKTGKITQPTKNSWQKSTNFQLQFYKLMTDSFDSSYYDLNRCEVVSESFFDEKLNLLDEKLEELKVTEIDFIKTHDIKNCIYCPYKLICGRVL